MTPRLSRRRASVTVIAGLVVASLGCGSPAAPSSGPGNPTMNLTGTWTGTATDSTGPGQMAWQITQTGTSFSGTLTLLDSATGSGGHGSVTGSLSGASIHFSISIPAGGFDEPFASCTADVSGDGQVSASSITGTYAGSNSCTGSVGSGGLTLAKAG